MRSWNSSWVVAVMAALVLSGCSGSKPSADKDPTSTDDPYSLPSGVSNILQGMVTSSDQSPILNATVEVLGLGVNQTTNDAGEYRFENLVPRDYLIVASKDGYRTKTQRAIIEDGKIFLLNFLLEDRPLTKPYNTTLPFAGMISCQVSYGTNPENVAYTECGTLDGNNKPSKDFDVMAGAAQIQIEADWVPRSNLARNLTMQVESVGFGHQDVVFGRQTGERGLKMPISESLMRKYYPNGGQVRVTMHAAPNVGSDDDPVQAGIAVQQDFRIYFTIFYVEVGPPNFSAIQR